MKEQSLQDLQEFQNKIKNLSVDEMIEMMPKSINFEHERRYLFCIVDDSQIQKYRYIYTAKEGYTWRICDYGVRSESRIMAEDAKVWARKMLIWLYEHALLPTT